MRPDGSRRKGHPPRSDPKPRESHGPRGGKLNPRKLDLELERNLLSGIARCDEVIVEHDRWAEGNKYARYSHRPDRSWPRMAGLQPPSPSPRSPQNPVSPERYVEVIEERERLVNQLDEFRHHQQVIQDTKGK